MEKLPCPKCGRTHTGTKEHFPNRERYQCYECGVTWSVWSKKPEPIVVESDKKTGVFNWREWSANIKKRQELHERASWSQDTAQIKITTPYRHIVFKPLADNHIGDLGTDYAKLEEITDEIIKIPYLYLGLVGDEEDNFVSFKNQLAILQQTMTPEEQDEFVISWLAEISDKLLFATWGNHAEFEERVSGRNTLKKILNRNAVYFNGIGICTVELNGVKYKIAATHKPRFNSSFNKTHGLKQLARREIPDADLYLSGHFHDPSMEISFERGMYQIFAVLGSLKHNDGFSKRYFSAFSAREDFAFVMDTKEKRIVPFQNLDLALEYAKVLNG